MTACKHHTLKEARIIIESWRCHYDTVRSHSSLRAMAGCATRTSFAGQPSIDAKEAMH
jgi:hypothetical protein